MHFAPEDLELIAKKRVATELLIRLADANEIVISTQVLGEFFITMKRKVLGLPTSWAMIETNWLSSYQTVPISRHLVRSAMEQVIAIRISYSDALIIDGR